MVSKSEGGFLISRIHQKSGRIFNRLLKENGIEEINPAQGRILFVLWREDNISIKKLSERTSLGQSTLTSMLDRLEKTGYICRVQSPEDRRKILIRRTEKDKQLQAIYDKVSREMTELFYEDFSDDEIEIFETCLKRILVTLNRQI